MATKAETYRSGAEKKGRQGKTTTVAKKSPPRRKARHIGGAQGTTSIARKASYELESNAGERPKTKPNRGEKRTPASRKSTRRASNRVKPDANLRRRTERRVHAPKSRAERA